MVAAGVMPGTAVVRRSSVDDSVCESVVVPVDEGLSSEGKSNHK